MDKRLLFPQNTERARDIFFVKEDRPYLQKHASGYHPEIQNYIQNAKPMDGLIQVLLTALGAYPFWPQNVNGDRFMEKALANSGEDYGYKTFVTNANYFTHHVNKDPALAKGKVLHAVWNEKAKRVELVIGIDPKLDPDAAVEIEAGRPLAFSMGARLPFDVCSVCANKARTRAEYCDHLRYQMSQIDPESGMLVGALNPFPKFFDISRVLIPADKTAFMWEKVAASEGPLSKLSSALLAELPPGKIADIEFLTKTAEAIDHESKAVQEKKARLLSKRANISKNAFLRKRIMAVSDPKMAERLQRSVRLTKMALEAAAPTINMGDYEKYGLAKLLMTMLTLGIVPKPTEAEQLTRLFAPSLDVKPKLGDFSMALARKLMPLMPERSYLKPYLVRRVVILSRTPEVELSKMAGLGPQKGEFNPGLAAALLAAVGTLLYTKPGIGRLVKEHPILSVALGALAIRQMRLSGGGPSRATFGEVSLADPTRGFYTGDWQRRFAQQQARPVTVIKTGSSSASHVNRETLLNYGFDGTSLMFALEGISPQSTAEFIENNPHLFEGGALSKQASAVNSRVSDLLTSAQRIVKTASLDDLEFLSIVPEEDRSLVWDLAIFRAANKIAQNL